MNITSPNSFAQTTPEAVGITSASLLNLLDTVEQRGINLHSLMVLRHGQVAAQMWWTPYAPDEPHQLYSFSKSVVSAAIALAESEGLLHCDDRIASFFPRRIKPDADPRIFSVTVEHLLTMTSGAFSQNETGLRGQDDWVEWFLNTPLSHFPGDRFIYNSMNTYMLSAILCRVTGMGLVDYLMPRLFEPLGIRRPMWDKCPMGIECGGWGLYLKTEDMAKFCQLCLDDGVWQGRRILPEGWAARAGSSLVPSSTDSKLNDSPHRISGYGHQFWRNGDDCSWRADGMFGQYGLIMPQKDMVIITTGGHAAQMEVLDVLYDVFIPCVDDIPEGTLPSADYEELLHRTENLRLGSPNFIPGQRAKEEQISGRWFDFPMNRRTLLPLPIRYLHRTGSLGVSGLRFVFSGDQPALCWKEDGTENILPFRTDGSFCRCELICSQRCYHVVTTAGWTDESTLEIDIRLIRTAHMQRLTFRFEDDGVLCLFNEDPSLEQMLKMLIDFAEPMRPMAERMARLVRRMLPGIRGRLRPK